MEWSLNSKCVVSSAECGTGGMRFVRCLTSKRGQFLLIGWIGPTAVGDLQGETPNSAARLALESGKM